jgi:D-arginine dehydrogenase
MTTSADIAIIGGGIAGLSLAAAIGDRASVVVIEAEPELFHHTSSRSAQQMQPTYGPAPVRALTSVSIPMVEARADRAGLPIYVSRPLLWTDHSEDRTRFETLLETVAGLTPIGADEAVRLLPALKRELLVDAAVDLSAVEVDVPVLLGWYRDDALEAGVTIVPGSRVAAVERVGDVWRLVAGGETVEAPVVVDAAGAWADAVAALFGARRRGLVPKRRTVVVAQSAHPVDPTWPMASDVADRYYFRPRGQAILASALEDAVSEPEDAQPLQDVVQTVLDRLAVATDLDLGAPITTWTGLRTLSPDTSPVVGFDDDVPGFFWLAGQGGYGIQTSAALAQLAAGLLLDAEHGLPGLDGVAEQLSPARL